MINGLFIGFALRLRVRSHPFTGAQKTTPNLFSALFLLFYSSCLPWLLWLEFCVKVFFTKSPLFRQSFIYLSFVYIFHTCKVLDDDVFDFALSRAYLNFTANAHSYMETYDLGARIPTDIKWFTMLTYYARRILLTSLQSLYFNIFGTN